MFDRDIFRSPSIGGHGESAPQFPKAYRDGDGSEANASLTADGAGNFFTGQPPYGGLGYGVVFELSPNGKGGWNETILYSFTGGSDGAVPQSSKLIFDSAGNLYGTAVENNNIDSGGPCANAGCGVVFELSPMGASWSETVLYTFLPANWLYGTVPNPINGLIFDKAGNLYGTTLTGGINSGGTVFELRSSRWQLDGASDLPHVTCTTRMPPD